MNAFKDPRLKIDFADALEFVDSSNKQYDVIIIDVPDPLEYGPAYKLFTLEFFLLLKSRMKLDGILVDTSRGDRTFFFRTMFYRRRKYAFTGF